MQFLPTPPIYFPIIKLIPSPLHFSNMQKSYTFLPFWQRLRLKIMDNMHNFLQLFSQLSLSLSTPLLQRCHPSSSPKYISIPFISCCFVNIIPKDRPILDQGYRIVPCPKVPNPTSWQQHLALLPIPSSQLFKAFICMKTLTPENWICNRGPIWKESGLMLLWIIPPLLLFWPEKTEV